MNINVTLDEFERELILQKLRGSLRNLMLHDRLRGERDKKPEFTERIAKMRALINKLEGNE